jgi:hypothetical protein
MEKIEITVTVMMPDVEYTYEELEEWAQFQIGQTGGISLENPLYENDPEITDVNV